MADGAEKVGLNETDVFHVELACDEACTNIIEHAYGGEDRGKIRISWQLIDDDFTITIHDNGRSFDPQNIPAPPLSDQPDETPLSDSEIIGSLQVGGLGIHFMRKLMDEVHFQFDQKKGNTLILIKKRSDE